MVGDAELRPDLDEILRELILDIIGAIDDWGLEVPEAFLAAGVAPPNLALVILGEAPLAATVGDGFFGGVLGAVPAQAIGVIGLVDPVIHGPDQAALLVFEITALGAAEIPELLAVRHAVALGVAIDEDVHGVGLINEHAVVEGQDHARQEHLVAVDNVLVEITVTLGALVARDDADRIVLIVAINVLHVSAQFGDVHAAVTVEGQVGWLLNSVAFTEHELQAVARREFDGLELFLWGEDLDRRLRGEVGLIGFLVGSISHDKSQGRQEDSVSHGGKTANFKECSDLASRMHPKP